MLLHNRPSLLLHVLHKHKLKLGFRITEPTLQCLLCEVKASRQKRTYVNVHMRWKKDSYYDSIDAVHKSAELKPLTSLKNCITLDGPDGCIPISAVSKKGTQLGLPASAKVAAFLRKYPSVFQEFPGPLYNLPWFRLTPEAAALDREERAVYAHRAPQIWDRLKRLILMSREKRLPLKVIQGLRWHLGLPEDDFLPRLDGGCFRVVPMEDETTKGLAVVDGRPPAGPGEEDCRILSAIQRGTGGGAIEFLLFPSPGLRLKTKIANWLVGFQSLPYVSPYEEFSHLDPSSDVAEKRVVGVAHELLSLFVEHSAERKRLLPLRKYLGLPQKFHKVFQRHPHIFYLSLKNKTCTVILKEAYNLKNSECGVSGIEAHPLSEVRRKYIRLMEQSQVILRNRGMRNRAPPPPTPTHDLGNKVPDLESDSSRKTKIEKLS